MDQFEVKCKYFQHQNRAQPCYGAQLNYILYHSGANHNLRSKTETIPYTYIYIKP